MTSIKNNNIKEMVRELEVLQNIEVTIQNTKIDNLCEIIMKSLLKEKYTLIDYIDTVFANLSFFPGLDILLKFEVYTKIMKDYFNSPSTINFDETEINVTDEISVEIILDLFKKVPRDELFIQSLVILSYESNKHIIKKYNISQILKAIEITFINVTEGIEIAHIIYNEKVLGDFVDALKHLNSEDNTIKIKKNKKKKKKKKNKGHKLGDTTNTIQDKNEKSIELISKDKNNQTISTKSKEEQNLKSPIIKEEKSSKSIISKELNSINDRVENKEQNNKNIKKGGNLKNYINDLLTKLIKMESNNEDILKELKDIISNLIDNNNNNEQKLEKMREDINNLVIDKENMKKEIKVLSTTNDNMQNKIKDMQKEIKNLSGDNEILNEKIEKLGDEHYEFKKIIGSIQTRDLGKRFLKSFYQYLYPEDFQKMRSDKSLKGKIISDRIMNIFYKFKNTKKMKMVVSLIKNSADSLSRGNDYAHNLIIDNYEDEIEEYKNNKKISMFNSPNLFCFLVGLDITKDLLEESYSFLKGFFDNDMEFINDKTLFLKSYFK